MQTASQVSAGRKNNFRFEIYGSKASLTWDGERPDELWIGHRDAPNQIQIKDPSLMLPAARSYADLPGGHSEGYDDTFKQVFRRFYQSIGDVASAVEYPQFRLLPQFLEEGRSPAWVEEIAVQARAAPWMRVRWPHLHPTTAAAGEGLAWWFPVNPDPRLACQATPERARWRCRPPAERNQG